MRSISRATYNRRIPRECPRKEIEDASLDREPFTLLLLRLIGSRGTGKDRRGQKPGFKPHFWGPGPIDGTLPGLRDWCTSYEVGSYGGFLRRQ